MYYKYIAKTIVKDNKRGKLPMDFTKNRRVHQFRYGDYEIRGPDNL